MNAPPITLPKSLLTLDSIAASAIAEARQRDEARRTGRPLGPQLSGFSSALANYFDLRGFPHLGFGLIHGRSGSAKTAAATTIAMTCNVPALIVESEMRPIRIAERMTAASSGEYLRHFVDGTLIADQIADRMKAMLAANPMVAMLDATTSGVTMAEIAECAARWREIHNADHVLVVLDSLQSWAASALAEIREEYPRMNTAIDQIKITATKAGAFFLVISERSNAASNSADSAHGKGSGRTGYAGEITLALDTAGEYDHVTARTPLNLTIAKNRWGAQHVTVPLWFEGRVQRFTDAAEPHRKKDSTSNGTVAKVLAPLGPPRPAKRVTNEADNESLPTLKEYINGN